LLSNCLLNCVYCELFTEAKVGFWDGLSLSLSLYIYIYVFIWKSVDVYTGYVVREREGNLNIGQYYIS